MTGLLTLFGVALAASFGLALSLERSRHKQAPWRSALAFALVFALVAASLMSAGAWALSHVETMLRPLGLAYAYAIAILGLVAARLLYWLKESRPRRYAQLQIGVGMLGLLVFSQMHKSLVVAAPGAFSLGDYTGWVAGFVAPVYIMVRGFGDLAEAGKAEAGDAMSGAQP
jgi:chromate transport protein ChrA